MRMAGRFLPISAEFHGPRLGANFLRISDHLSWSNTAYGAFLNLNLFVFSVSHHLPFRAVIFFHFMLTLSFGSQIRPDKPGIGLCSQVGLILELTGCPWPVHGQHLGQITTTMLSFFREIVQSHLL